MLYLKKYEDLTHNTKGPEKRYLILEILGDKKV